MFVCRSVRLYLSVCNKKAREYAVQLKQRDAANSALQILQVRPMVVEQASHDVDVNELAACAHPVVISESALGHGRTLETQNVVSYV